jgi:hypothetical protein
MTPLRTLWTAYARHRFAVLFATLLLALVGHPLLEVFRPGANLIEWLLALSLGAAVLGIEVDRRIRTLLGLVAAFVGVRIAAGVIGSPGLFDFGQALWAGACLLTTGLLVRHALQRGPVDSERIFAALDAYLLGAAAFGVVYWLLDRTWPGSIGPQLDAALAADEALYLSLVSISTVGFGDLVPVSGLARALVTLEAVGGQMYLAVLVARLVSLYTAGERRSQ